MKDRNCKVPGCIKPYTVLKHRLCRTHYLRLLSTGSVGSPFVRPYRAVDVFDIDSDPALKGISACQG